MHCLRRAGVILIFFQARAGFVSGVCYIVVVSKTRDRVDWIGADLFFQWAREKRIEQ